MVGRDFARECSVPDKQGFQSDRGGCGKPVLGVAWCVLNSAAGPVATGLELAGARAANAINNTRSRRL